MPLPTLQAAMLCHGNLLHQLEALDFLGAHAGQKTVSYLPPWHMYAICWPVCALPFKLL